MKTRRFLLEIETPHHMRWAILAHRADPKGHVSDPKGRASEKWTRFSAFHDALSEEASDPKVVSTFGSDALAPRQQSHHAVDDELHRKACEDHAEQAAQYDIARHAEHARHALRRHEHGKAADDAQRDENEQKT